MIDWQTVATIGSVIAVVGSFIVWFWRRGLPALRKWSRFADRVMGVPADPHTGQPEIPGIFERMDAQDAVLETIRHEVEFNNGSSVKDAVTRVEKALTDHLNAPTTPSTTININPEATP